MPGRGERPSPPDLFGLNRQELTSVVASFSERPFHAAQVYRQMYARLETDLQAMTDLPAPLRQELGKRFRIAWPSIKTLRRSADGSKKYLLTLADGGDVECVYILYGTRVTLCLSSQIGCPLACRFCLTGTMGLVRNLTPGEILGQLAVMARDNALLGTSYRVVFMGMGEPLNNYEPVMHAFRIMVDPKGIGLSPRRITLSTVGLVPGIEKLAKESPRPRLAISLGASRDALRDDLVPVNRKYNLQALTKACRRFPLGPREKITFEYCLIDGVNDGPEDARELARLTRGLRVKVNVIPYNETGVPGFMTPSIEGASRFQEALKAGGVSATIRWSKGRDVGAACGQLATALATSGSAESVAQGDDGSGRVGA